MTKIGLDLLAVLISLLLAPSALALNDSVEQYSIAGESAQEFIRTGNSVTGDADNDGVSNDIDQCNDSAAGFPVRGNGCAVLNGVLSGVKFKQGSAELTPDSMQELSILADLLTKYPMARIQLLAHTDNTGSMKQQATLTRARLRSIGTYLLQQGVRANRLILRSLGGSSPIYDNSTPHGRSRNNRIELIEQR